MANSGPGWQAIDIAWERLNAERDRATQQPKPNDTPEPDPEPEPPEGS